ncbi:MAG TPA: GNAT family N-acetyltransferase [Thermotogota bacterium]|nr:GNAT family N-acetyltransferase [Thermotogota bacterium]HPJ88825.1 GNAT family N-acetyltransferase [Thermotogota bacterium]HPR96688.1 GNAT family N-acetyltransferase [Thermotogota bacterium]
MFIKRIENSVEGAVDLLLSEYKRQKKILEYLPEADDHRKSLAQKTAHLFEKGSGFAFYEGNRLIAFLAGYRVKRYFGSADGIYIPLHGHGISPEVTDRVALYQKMYAFAAENWVREDILSHVITVFSKDEELVRTWFDLGFGNRCVDAIRIPSEIKQINSEIVIRMATVDGLDSLEEIYRKDQLYFNNSPMFMPRENPAPIRQLKDWLNENRRYLWIAFLEKQPVGFIRIEEEGENYITEHPHMMNITGAYVDESHRGKGIGATMLNAVQKFLIDVDYRLCGVDFESFNISGAAFWNTHFTPYTYSLTRRIDENIL